MAAAKKARAVEFGSVRHTDESLRQMKTGEIAVRQHPRRLDSFCSQYEKGSGRARFWARRKRNGLGR